MLAARARILIVTLWVGSLWTVGYIVAPTLFGTLPDRVLAGSIAGSLFRIEAWLSLVSALALLVLMKLKEGMPQGVTRRFWLSLILGMLACTLIGYFGVQPFMAALRESAGPGGVMESAVRTRFAVIHGVSSAFYLIQSLLGIALVLKAR